MNDAVKLVILTLALSVAAPAAAQMAPAEAAACPATPAALPPELAGWPDRTPLTAATKASRPTLAPAQLALGKAVDLALRPTPEVAYPLRPAKPGGTVSHGGLAGFAVTEAGTYRVALGAGAWIDVVRGGKAAESTAHGHGPACSGVRKMVDFALTPGRYILQIAGNGTPTIPVMVTRLP